MHAALLTSLLVLLVPVMATTLPPLNDYPNHLARMWLLGGGATVPPVAGMYAITWDTLNNIGIDLAAVALSRMFDYLVVGRILVAAAVILPPLGGMLLWRVLYGRFHWWQLSFPILAWSGGLLMGFMNFEIGLGLALLAAAADPIIARRGVSAALTARIVFAAVLLLVHVSAWVFYGFLLAGMLFGHDLSALRSRSALLRLARALLVMAFALVVPLALMIALAPSIPGADAGGSAAAALESFKIGLVVFAIYPVLKLKRLFFGLMTATDWLDLMSGVLLLLPLGATIMRRPMQVHAGLMIATAGMLGCFLIFPSLMIGLAYIDARFACMALLTFLAAVRPRVSQRSGWVFATLLFAGSILRTGVVLDAWLARQSEITSFARALSAVPAGASVLPLDHHVPHVLGALTGSPLMPRSLGGHSYQHLPSLAIPRQHAFVPTLFAARGSQPITVLPPWGQIAATNGGRQVPSVNALVMPDVYQSDIQFAPYLKFWRDRFDYAVVMNADLPDENGPFVPPPGMELVRDEGFAQLYRFTHTPPAR